MTAFYVAAGILLFLLLLSLVRLGGEVRYTDSGLRANVRIAGFRIPVFPRSPKKQEKAKKEKKQKQRKQNKKQKKQKKVKEQEEQPKPRGKEPQEQPGESPHPIEEQEKKKGGSISLVLDALPIVSDACGDLKRKIRIDTLELVYTAAGAQDAAGAAIQYGGAWVLLGNLVPLLENNFDLRKRDLRAELDFGAQTSSIYLDAALSLTVGQLCWLAIKYGKQVYALLHKQKLTNTGKEA